MAEWDKNRVQKFDTGGGYLKTFGSSGGDGSDLDHPSVHRDDDGVDLRNCRNRLLYRSLAVVAGDVGNVEHPGRHAFVLSGSMSRSSSVAVGRR